MLSNQFQRDQTHFPFSSFFRNLMGDLNMLMTKLKAEFITDSGLINYSAMKKSPLFEEYQELAGNLSRFDATKLNDLDRKTFFINLYNCQTLHVLTIQADLPQSPKDTEGMWSKYAYNIGGLILTLDQLEHGVLRSNAGHPSATKEAFGESDPRRKLVIPAPLDPRIHFALNCGAKSCPPIRIYQSEKLEKQLDTAAKSFCSQVGSHISKNVLLLSRL